MCNGSIQDNVKINVVLPKYVHYIKIFLNRFCSQWRNEYVTSICEYDKKYKQNNDQTNNH